MTSDPLYDPLGTTPRPEARRGAGVFALVAAVLVGASGAAMVMRRPSLSADRSMAVAAIEVAPRVPAPPPATPAPAPVAPAEASAGGAQAATPSSIDDLNRANGDTVEIQNGVKIIRLGAAMSSKSVAIPVPNAASVAASHQAMGLVLR